MIFRFFGALQLNRRMPQTQYTIHLWAAQDQPEQDVGPLCAPGSAPASREERRLQSPRAQPRARFRALFNDSLRLRTPATAPRSSEGSVCRAPLSVSLTSEGRVSIVTEKRSKIEHVAHIPQSITAERYEAK